MKYEIIGDNYQAVVCHNVDGTDTWIPLDPANSDYQRYLRWLENPDAEEGGTL